MSIVEDILNAAHQPYLRHSTKKDEINLNCPFCSERGHVEDTKRKLGINTGKFLSNCHRCHFHTRGLRPLVKQLCRIYQLPEPDLYSLSEISFDAEDEEPEPEQEVKLPNVEPTGFPEGYETFKFTEDDEVEVMAYRYLRMRGVSLPQIGQHRIGFAACGTYSYRIIFPVLGKDQQVYGYACRSFADQPPRYLNSNGTKMLWGAHRKAKVAVECEGVMDGLSVERATLNLKDVIAVAPLGSATTDVQLKQLEEYETVILFPDRDRAGVKGCIARANKYKQHGLRVYAILPQRLDEKDPGKLAPEQIRAELDRATPWTEYSEYHLRSLPDEDI